MDNEQQHVSNKSSKAAPILIVGAVVVIIIVGVIVFSMSNRANQATQDVLTEQQAPVVPNTEGNNQPTQENPIEQAQYQDGTYEVVGNYTSPGGEESIDVTLTLTDGVVTDANVVSNATRPISKQMQAAFIGGFKEQVVGKSIDEINVTKVSSSSLTPKGFMDAVAKVKAEASA